MANDLNLQSPVSGSNDLNFGDPGGPVVSLLTADVTLGFQVDAEITNADTVSADVILPAFSPDAELFYDVAVWRGEQNSTTAQYETAGRHESSSTAQWPPYARLKTGNASPWEQAKRVASSVAGSFLDLLRLPNERAIRYDAAAGVQQSREVAHAYPPRRRDERSTSWQVAENVERAVRVVHLYPGRKQATRGHDWQKAETAGRSVLLIFSPSPKQRRNEWWIPWDEGRGVVSLWPRPDPWTPEPVDPYVPTPDLNFCFEVVPDSHDLPIGRVCSSWEPPNQPVIIPIRRVYLMIHDIDVVRLPDRYTINASRISISLDADSWAWQWSGTLLGAAALDAVQPDQDGQPVTLEVSVNGYVWHLLVEDWTDDRQFGRRAVSVKGRGLTAWLGQPYVLPTSGQTASDMTAQQVAASHLPIGDGWSIDWQASDWLVPAGAWTWQNQPPALAIQSIAQAVGYTVRPGMADRVIHIQPRYPVLPWDYGASTPALVIPDASIISLSRRQSVATQANAVYVHGGDVGGVLARAKRVGSAADRVAPTVNHTLLTHVDACRALGSRLLAAQERQPEVRSITLPMDGQAIPLGQIGDLLRADIGADSHYGIINSVGIELQRGSGGVTVRQTLSIGEDTPNQWSKFSRLVPSDPLLVGTVDQQHGNGTVSATLIGGGSMRVRGDAAPGATVYIRGGRIEGAAPSLPMEMIEV